MSETLEEWYPKEIGTQVHKQLHVPKDCVTVGKKKERGQNSNIK